MVKVTDLVTRTLDRLRGAQVEFAPGLTVREVDQIEEEMRITFASEHRDLLMTALPIGDRWPNWRGSDPAELRSRLDWPIDGVVFDIHNNGFWPSTWGDRPAAPKDAEGLARSHLALVPQLVPIYSHRYLPEGSSYTPSPVFSVYQTDVVIYGDDLLDYVAHEFNAPPLHPAKRQHVPFWSDLAEGHDSADL